MILYGARRKLRDYIRARDGDDAVVGYFTLARMQMRVLGALMCRMAYDLVGLCERHRQGEAESSSDSD